MEMKGIEQANRPTKSVIRWLEEDQASAGFWRSEAFSLCAELGLLGCDDSERRDKVGRQLAERLRDETQEASPLRGFDPYAEFVTSAIDDVDWYGVAQGLIGYVCREVAAEYRSESPDEGADEGADER